MTTQETLVEGTAVDTRSTVGPTAPEYEKAGMERRRP